MRTLTLTIVMLLCTWTYAQNEQTTLALIEKANAEINQIESQFTQTKTIAANEKKIKSSGTLYIKDDDKMAMHYHAPATDLLIINGEQFYMIRGKKKNRFNTGKNKAMRSLRNTLLYCVHGKPALLAQENNATLTVNTDNEGYTVILTSQKKTPRGYEKIILNYDAKSKLLTRMQMDEWNGNSTLYEMSRINTNGNIAPKQFEIPQK